MSSHSVERDLLEDDAEDDLTTKRLELLFRRQRWHLSGFGIVIVAGLLVLGLIANAGKQASEGNALSAEATFATQVRSSCITARRSAESDALGRENDAILLSLKAAFIDDDGDELARQIAAGEEAVEDRKVAAASLVDEVLNEPAPVGCGAPVTSSEQITP